MEQECDRLRAKQHAYQRQMLRQALQQMHEHVLPARQQQMSQLDETNALWRVRQQQQRQQQG